MTRRRLARSAATLAVSLAALAAPALSFPASVAHAAPPKVACPPGSEWVLRDLVNAFRQANGRSALPLSAELMAKAQAWSDSMASTGKLTHSTLSQGLSPGWGSVSENVAYNYSVAAAQTALQNSSGHRANLLSDVTEMGLGIAEGANGTIWVTQVFVKRSTPTAAYRGLANTSTYMSVAPAVVFSGGAVRGGTTSTFAVAGTAGVPAGATAAVVTIDADRAAGRGWVQALAPGATVGSSSNLNLVSGRAANTAIVPLAADGTMRLYNSVQADLTVTVTGAFVATPGPATAGRFQAVTPSRLLDTRAPTRVGYTGDRPTAGATVTVQVGGRGGVPATGVRAAVLNVVAVRSDGAGELQVGPGGMATGAWRNVLVAREYQVAANLVVVPLDAQGRAEIHTTVGTHLVADVTGWFTGSSAGASMSGLFVPATPARFMDTRGRPAVHGAATVDVSGRFDIPRCPQAVLGNLTIIPTVSPAYAQAGPLQQFTAGAYSNINADVVLAPVANAVLLRTGAAYDLGVWTSAPAHVIVDVSGWFV